jgi:hypothetical protein
MILYNFEHDLASFAKFKQVIKNKGLSSQEQRKLPTPSKPNNLHLIKTTVEVLKSKIE